MRVDKRWTLMGLLHIFLISHASVSVAAAKKTAQQDKPETIIASWIFNGQDAVGEASLKKTAPFFHHDKKLASQQAQKANKLLHKTHARVVAEKKRQVSMQARYTTLSNADASFISVKQPASPLATSEDKASFSQATGLLSAVDAMKSDISRQGETVSVFLGKAMQCHKLARIPLLKSCCTTALKSSPLVINHCPLSAYKLASARREGRAHWVGHRCIKRARLLLGKLCLKRAEVYCVFASSLARLVQEKGRQQLQVMFHTKSSEDQNTTIAHVTWPCRSPAGRWYRLPTAPTAVAVWSQADYHPLKDEVFFAVCRRGEQCGVLPQLTRDELEVSETSVINGWVIRQAHLQEQEWWHSIDKVWMKGQCPSLQEASSIQPAPCQWTIKQVGQSGYPDVLTDDIQWQLFPESALLDKKIPENNALSPVITTGTGIKIKPFLYSDKKAIKEQSLVQISVQLPGKDWRIVKLPIVIDQSENKRLNAHPTIKIWGGCVLSTGLCHYWLASRVIVKPLSWGTAKHPNCRGLTPAELLLIDWQSIVKGAFLF